MKTKQKILNAALRVLVENGFQALTQTRVAEAAGVSQGNLTYYFPTRNDLLKAVVDESKTQMVALSASSQAPLTVEALAEITLTMALSKNFRQLMLALTVAGDDDPTLAVWFTETDLNTRQKLRTLLAQMGLDVDESALHLLRATVVGASLIHSQQNTEASEHVARLVIKAAYEQLIQNACPLPSV